MRLLNLRQLKFSNSYVMQNFSSMFKKKTQQIILSVYFCVKCNNTMTGTERGIFGLDDVLIISILLKKLLYAFLS